MGTNGVMSTALPIRAGRMRRLLLPEVDTGAMHPTLGEFARAERVGPRKQVVLVLDRAPWHRTPKLLCPRGLHLAFLPPCTPELQPAERLWPLVNEGLANCPFATIHALDRALVRRCRQLLAQPDRIRAVTAYH